MKIIIAGDIVPTESNKEIFEEEDLIKKIDKKLANKLENADFRIYNLETPLSENCKSIEKSGPALNANPKSIKGIKSLKPDLICLANNHSLDYGIKGLDSTIKLLQQEDIQFTGIIENIEENLEGHILEKDDTKIGIYNVCENEFSVATINTKGPNSLTGPKNYLDIQRLKKKCDYVIVIYHGGKERYRYPTPELQRICRGFIDFGADLVTTQHSHCIGCEELYCNKKIIYGQGNFIFNDCDNTEYTKTSIVLKVMASKERLDVEYIPIEKHKNLIQMSNDENILKDFYKRSNEIKDKGFLYENYSKFAQEKFEEYLKIANGYSFWDKILNRFYKMFGKKYLYEKYNKQKSLDMLNALQCEAHREIFIQGLKNHIL